MKAPKAATSIPTTSMGIFNAGMIPLPRQPFADNIIPTAVSVTINAT